MSTEIAETTGLLRAPESASNRTVALLDLPKAQDTQRAAALLRSEDRAGRPAPDPERGIELGLTSPEAGTAEAPVGLRPVALQSRSARAAASQFGRWRRRYVNALLSSDAVAGAVAVVVVGTFFPPASHFAVGKLVTLVIGACLAWPLAIAMNRGYDRRIIGLGDEEFRSVLRAGVAAIAASAVPSAIVDKFGLVSLSTVAIPLAAVISVLVRVAGRRQLSRSQRGGRAVRKVVLVGSTRAVTELYGVLGRDHQGMAVTGVCVPSSEAALARREGLPVLGALQDVAAVVAGGDVDSVAVTGGGGTRQSFLKQLAWSLEGSDVELLVHPGLVEVAGPRMHIRPHVGLPLLQIEQPHFSGWRRFVKRAADLVLTSGFMLVFSPVFAAIALAVKLDGGGPVFYRQTRVGLDGSTFTMWKFRSMHTDADRRVAELRERNPELGLLFKLQDDPRITRVGKVLRKYSLDELPQLLNVLGGSMSLVGPRPPLPVEVEGYERSAHRRLLVTPGLTGLWQVSGRSLLSWEESIRLDLRYVENWTLTLDLLILWRTFFAVLTHRGAF